MRHTTVTLLLTILFVWIATSASAHDIEVTNDDGITIYYVFNINGDRTELAVSFRGSYAGEYSNEYIGIVSIPSSVTYNGKSYQVTSIGSCAFYCCSLTSVTIPEGVISIGDGTFSGCNGLTSINIPEGVTSIGDHAFNGCNSLSSITIPNSVVCIGTSAFESCSSLKSITIGNGVTSIGDRVFWGCSGLTSITIPGNVATIGNYAFSNCSSLISVTIEEGITSIGASAFDSCYKLGSIIIPNSVTNIGEDSFLWTLWEEKQPDGVVYAGRVAYRYKGNMPQDASIILKSGTKGIADMAFANNDELVSITIPNSVTSIGAGAFQLCSNLTSISIPESVARIGKEAFDWTKWYQKQPEGLIYAGRVAYKYKGEMLPNTSIVIKSGTVSISDEAFVDENYGENTCLSSIFIPGSVTNIGECAFSACRALTSITIQEGVTNIRRGAFSNCSSLSSITIPNSVVYIGSSAFESCNSLSSITIPNSVVCIGTSAFERCSSLKSITIGNGVTSIGDRAFFCNGLTSIVIEKGNTVYDSRNDCNAIIETKSNTLIKGCENTIIPNSVTSISQYAFSNCTGLTSIIIPEGVISIGDFAFSYCSSLTSVIIPSSVVKIGQEMLWHCDKLRNVYCYATQCPSVQGWIYFNFRADVPSAILHVPVSSIEDYCNNIAWDRFGSIEVLTDEEVGIESINNGQLTMGNEVGTWYTLDGKKLNSKPSTKGIFIRNGKTVLVK